MPLAPTLVVGFALLAGPSAVQAPEPHAPAPEEWGAPPVEVERAGGGWTIRGSRHSVVLDEGTLAIGVEAGRARWNLRPTGRPELRLEARGDEFETRLADAGEARFEPYRTGFASGVQVTLDRFRSTGIRAPGADADVRLYLTLALEGGDEDLLFEIAVVERGETSVQRLDWPPPVDGREVDATVLSHDDGMLLPRDWPRPYYAVHRARDDTSVIQSHLIESWSMSFWGFLAGGAGAVVIVETPDDAGYTFAHPAGGPTEIGPSWHAQLWRFGPRRSLRIAFLGAADHVALAKRYRRHVMETGQLVSLREKIARSPSVERLIGNPYTRARVLRNVAPGGPRYDAEHPESNYRLTTYAENAARLREWRRWGLESVNVTLTGWPNQGYDRQHPDGLPPNEAAGGWAGMKAFFDTCEELGYACWLHDQYRDYYPDAPSWDPAFAVHERDSIRPPTTFPGTRFHPHNPKEGYIPYLNYWDGGKQAYLANRYMLGHVRKNYRLVFEHGIRPRGSYNDVFGYVPPDRDFNPEHPSTRSESMRHRAEVLSWTRARLGIVGTEDGADWTVPHVDYVESRFNRNPGSGNDSTSAGAVPAPLYDLVYHDAVVTMGAVGNPRARLYGHAAQVRGELTEGDLDAVRRAAALHRRVGLLEMTGHAFLDPGRRRERTTFADGTEVTVDWETGEVRVTPPLPEP